MHAPALSSANVATRGDVTLTDETMTNITPRSRGAEAFSRGDSPRSAQTNELLFWKLQDSRQLWQIDSAPKYRGEPSEPQKR